MTEKQFLNELEQTLTRLPSDERNDILQDIKEHFSSAREDGKSDSEIAASLGSPQEIAEDLLPPTQFEETVKVATDSKRITITDNSFTKVAMNIKFGALTVYPSESDYTTIDLFNAPEKLVLTADVIGDTLAIDLKAPRFTFFTLLSIFKGVKVNVALPKKLYTAISMKTDNGSIRAEKLLGKNMKATSDNGSIGLKEIAATTLDVETDNGRIEIDKVQVDKLSTETDNGRIEMRYVDADHIRTETDNGRIVMEYVTGTIVGKTDNGRIILLTSSLDRMINLQTDNGSILIESENDPTDVTIRAKVDHGRIDVFGEKNSSTTFGNGSNTIQLVTDNGRITVKKQSLSVLTK
ncbi:DUF4097 family beta strand repeat-containing protein [Paenisporosarcina indica]|uniref:DUF4097 family beta strand repeat-containing protein n=1 Tax=Paenisporosarcina indica TaxID=650093 RepID=UPI00094F9300|nr:DUF4097 family beta strand repeat-containing protein [Paenisporosarcina indica]